MVAPLPSIEQSKHILLMRHAEVDAKWSGRFLGASDPPLSEQGREQAAWWRREMASIPIDKITSSDQKRALQTAQIIAGAQGGQLDALPALREVNLGQWEGLPPSEVRRIYPKEYARRGQDMAGFPPPQGESLSALAARVLPVWQELCQSQEWRILLVAHAGVLRVILCDTLGVDLNRALSWRLDHASLSLLKYHKGRFTLLASNIPSQKTSIVENFLK